MNHAKRHAAVYLHKKISSYHYNRYIYIISQLNAYDMFNITDYCMLISGSPFEKVHSLSCVKNIRVPKFTKFQEIPRYYTPQFKIFKI